MFDVVVLALADQPQKSDVRVPVRACLDALAAAGARGSAVTATSDQEIDQVVAGLAAAGAGQRLVVASASDAQLRAVVRRMARHWAPPPSKRPPDLPAHRTMPDLPPLAVLPLDPAAGKDLPAGGGSAAGEGPAGPGDLAGQLGLPRHPAAVASAVLGERVRRVDLLRQDGGSVTLEGVLLGSSDQAGRAVPWQARIEVDDAVLSDGTEPLLAGVVANGGRQRQPDGLPLIATADPTDGVVEAAVAVPVRRRWQRRARVEVRRARGRAVLVRPTGDGVACLDDGVAGELRRQRSWWVEAGAWGVYTT